MATGCVEIGSFAASVTDARSQAAVCATLAFAMLGVIVNILGVALLELCAHRGPSPPLRGRLLRDRRRRCALGRPRLGVGFRRYATGRGHRGGGVSHLHRRGEFGRSAVARIERGGRACLVSHHSPQLEKSERILNHPHNIQMMTTTQREADTLREPRN